MVIVTRIFEFTYLFFFIAIVYSNYSRRNFRTLMELLSITLYALLLEYLAIKTYDAYQYSPDFIFQFGQPPDNVPIVIALSWAIIIGVSMKITDNAIISSRSKPFLDTLLALTIDLTMDVIAIRIEAGLWNWKINLSNSISFTSFIGVRYGNFIGWYLIVLVFSFFIRYGRDKFWLYDSKYYRYLLVIPVFALIPFFLLFEVIQLGKMFFNYEPYFMVMVVLLIGIALYLIVKDQDSINRTLENKLDKIELTAFYSFHIFFLLAFITLRIYQSAPLIIIPSLFAMMIHYLSHGYLLVDKKAPSKMKTNRYKIGK